MVAPPDDNSNDKGFGRKLLYSIGEASRLLSLSRRKLEYLISRGEVQTLRVGRRRLISDHELRVFTRRDH